MTKAQSAFLRDLVIRFFADRPKQPPSDWCCKNLYFDEPDNRGPFNLSGREYSREWVDSWADPVLTDLVLVKGSQLGGTGSIMGGAAWTIENEPSRLFWVMPTRPTVQKFSRTRWQPLIRRAPTLSKLVPTGGRRHEFSTFEQIIGASIVDMVWSNSPAALASVPARVVILDEVDKFDEGGAREANAVILAEQRTKTFANPKRIKTSTPTLVTGLIWQELLKSDLRRRFVPCPHCGRQHPSSRQIVLLWSKKFTCFRLTPEDAPVVWDKEAKRKDGTWDLDRVERSARFECPHCGGHILDAHKTWMDRLGAWRPTQNAARGYRGWHLPSLYSSAPECNIGKLAVKFLQAQQSMLGLQGFINGDLAEPYSGQDTMQERVEIVTSKADETAPAEGRDLLTVDCQFKSPFFWWLWRKWSATQTTAIKAGSCDTFEEIRAIQLEAKIPDVGVVVDSGHGAKSDAEVYANCGRFSEWVEVAGGRKMAIGWLPSKGMPSYRRWRHPDKNALLPWYLGSIDPYADSSTAGEHVMNLLEFSGDYFKDILASLRAGKILPQWRVSEEVNKAEFYWHHMDAEIKQPIFNRLTGHTTYQWAKRGKRWPNHLLDCEVLQLVAACFFGILELDRILASANAPKSKT